MKKLNICIVDLITKSPTNDLFARIMNANFASIMPQVIATWCEQAGHKVTLVTYTGFENLEKEVPEKADLVFISSFTQAALTAYALSNRFRQNGAVTVLGGPHARCYPQDALKYFDYVFGFTNKELIYEVLNECTPHRPYGVLLKAGKQPVQIPGVRERWKFVAQTLRKAPLLKITPMIGSMGCPYTCAFCIDSTVPYQPLDFDVMKDDLRFLVKTFKRPQASWHDPNFGIRFDETLGAIEEAVPSGSIEFIAESSLSLLSEDHVKRLKNAGFKAILPGIESWFELGGKSKTGKRQGIEKVNQVSEQVNMIMKYIPYMQCNFVMGLDSEEGAEPFELTKRFVDKAPAAFPGYSLLTAFGQAAPLNLEYQRENRVLPFPFHFL
ncbi:MAG: radical SAM protein, partial [Bacteroidota bacterium]